MIRLRLLEPQDYERCYRWLNDPEVNRYLFTKFPSKKEIAAYYENLPPNSKVFAIIDEKSREHIGNAKLDINWQHRWVEVGMIIGNKSYWKKSYGTATLKYIVDYAFNTLNLHRVQVGIIADNIGAIKSAEKAGMVWEGILKDYQFIDGKYRDAVRYAIISRKKID